MFIVINSGGFLHLLPMRFMFTLGDLNFGFRQKHGFDSKNEKKFKKPHFKIGKWLLIRLNGICKTILWKVTVGWFFHN